MRKNNGREPKKWFCRAVGYFVVSGALAHVPGCARTCEDDGRPDAASIDAAAGVDSLIVREVRVVGVDWEARVSRFAQP